MSPESLVLVEDSQLKGGENLGEWQSGRNSQNRVSVRSNVARPQDGNEHMIDPDKRTCVCRLSLTKGNLDFQVAFEFTVNTF